MILESFLLENSHLKTCKRGVGRTEVIFVRGQHRVILMYEWRRDIMIMCGKNKRTFSLVKRDEKAIIHDNSAS